MREHVCIDSNGGGGIGSILAKLAQKAIPLLLSEAKLAKPHLVKAAKGIAKDVTKTVAQVRRRKKSNLQYHMIFSPKMSLTHENSCECYLSPLEWFHILPTETAVEKTSDVEYQLLTSLKNNAPV